MATAGVVALAALAAGCGGSGESGAAGGSSGGSLAAALAYTRCIRAHGVQDFPEPTTPAGGGVTFSLDPGVSENPAFKTARRACRSLSPGGQQAPTASTRQLAEEVKWAQCLRTHGVPEFPDPNGKGAIDSGKFDPNSPAFQRASAACKSQQPAGSVEAVPGAP